MDFNLTPEAIDWILGLLIGIVGPWFALWIDNEIHR